jgi:glycosyltransferase involved in cell wall biosynthesis
MPEGKDVAVIPYGVDVEQFCPGPERPQNGPIVIGAVARLSPEKGLDVLLRAVALMRDRGIETQVILAGDGPNREELVRLAAELGLSTRVEFVGEVAHEDVPAVLRRMEIFVIPSTWEGFGVAALEASAMELPVVGSNIHGLPDVVLDGETGLLVPAGDGAKLAEAIGRLIADRDLRRRMGAAGRTFVLREYRWEDNARLMEALYERVMANVRS